MKEQNYKYAIGDYISSTTIRVGKVVDHVLRDSNNAFYIVEERVDACFSKTIKHYVPKVFEKNMRALPKASDVTDVLNNTPRDFSFVYKKTETQPSRYKFISDELKNPSFKKFSDIIHYLGVLEATKKITASEKKLLKSKKEQFFKEVEFITKLKEKEVNELMNRNIEKLMEEQE